MMQMVDYLVQYLPSPVHEGRRNKGYIDKMGERHRSVEAIQGESLMYGNGCLRHRCLDCDKCPAPDCDYSPTLEIKLKTLLHKGAVIVFIPKTNAWRVVINHRVLPDEFPIISLAIKEAKRQCQTA